MSSDQDTHLPMSSRFSRTRSPEKISLDTNLSQWSTTGGSLDKIRYIQSDSISAEGLYEPYQWPQSRPKSESSMKYFTAANRIHLDTSGGSGDVSEIPVYEYGKDFTADPILFVETVKEAGKKYGAVKVKMPMDFVTRLLVDQLLDPETLIFRTTRILNNPTENELIARLKFFSELLKFHASMEDISNKPLDSISDSLIEIHLADSNSVPTPQANLELQQQVKVESNSVVANEASLPADGASHAFKSPETIVKLEDTKIMKPESSHAQQDISQDAQARQNVPSFVSQLPTLGKRPLDLYEFFRLVIARGGFDEVSTKGLWTEIGHELGYNNNDRQKLNQFLEESYNSILSSFEKNLGDRKYAIGALAHKSNDSESRKRLRLNSGAPLILGSAKDFHRSVKSKASKGFLLNEPHLMNIKSPLVLGLKSMSAALDRRSSSKSKEEIYSPITPAAQVNHFVKWLACGLSNIQDASRYDYPPNRTSYLSLKQYMLKDIKFQQYLISSYPQVFRNSDLPSHGSLVSGGKAEKVAIEEFERLYWGLMENKDETNLLDLMKLESGICVPSSMVRSGFPELGDDFYESKEKKSVNNCQRFSPSVQNDATSSSIQSGSSSASAGSLLDSPSVATAGTLTKITSSALSPSETQNVTANQSISGQIDPGVSTTANGNSKSESTTGLKPVRYINRTLDPLNPFNIHNIPVLPNSLLGAYSALDVNNRDLVSSKLHVGMTFSTQNWSCEDHFTQNCNYHSFGAGKRWYFIPELEFEKFQTLIQEVTNQQSVYNSRVNMNYRKEDWHFKSLERVINNGMSGEAEYKCLNDSLENLLNPFPNIRANHKSDLFQKLIDKRKKQNNMSFNQEFLITPQLLREKGINFTTTVQQQGEFIFKYPKSYSSTFSFGVNLSEEINFASELWLDYAEEGEQWLSQQGILPNILIFRMLINFAQLHESSDSKCGHFDAGIFSKVLALYSKFLDRELALRAKIRETLKIKETTIEERNITDMDSISDDTLQNAFPSKIVISEAYTHHQLVMTLPGFLEYAALMSGEEDLEFNVITNKYYTIELQMFYSDEKLKSFQRLLSSYSVDFEAWLENYETILKSGEDISMKMYKNLLSEGWKIYSAVASSNYNFMRFSQDTKSQNTELAAKVKSFKDEVENLQCFVDESMELIEDCQTILSLKHQQRIRNPGGESTPQVNNEQQAGSLDLLLDLVNKIPKLNFYTPEFDQIFEFKSEIENFDRACRALIQKPNSSISELNDMISLGMSFGVQIPSLDFMTRLRDRQQWLSTYETIVSGGDPFNGKKDIFFLKHLVDFRDEGLRVLASKDIQKITDIDAYVQKGHSYDFIVTSYLLENSVLNKVELKKLDTIIDDMVERSKKTGSDRLFVTFESYSRLIDLKAQSGHIRFLAEYNTRTHNLFDIKQTLSELEACGFKYDGSLIQNDLARTHQWLDNVNTLFKQTKIVSNTRSKTKLPVLATRHASEPDMILSSHHIYNNCATAFAGEEVDEFTRSSSWVFMNNLDYHYDEKHPARYCMCREFEAGVMIECDRCHEWYHVNCVNAKSNIDDENEKYSCPVCMLLETYKFTGTVQEIPGKISRDSITKLIAKGELLRIVPRPEVQSLREIADLSQRAYEYFDKQMTLDVNVGYGPVYTMFIARKYYGSPICDYEQITKLFDILKEVDFPTLFKEALSRAEKENTVEIQNGGDLGSQKDSTVADSNEVAASSVTPTSSNMEKQNELTISTAVDKVITAPIHPQIVPILVSQKLPLNHLEASTIVPSVNTPRVISASTSTNTDSAVLETYEKSQKSTTSTGTNNGDNKRNEASQVLLEPGTACPPETPPKVALPAKVPIVLSLINNPELNAPLLSAPELHAPELDAPKLGGSDLDDSELDDSKAEVPKLIILDKPSQTIEEANKSISYSEETGPKTETPTSTEKASL